MNEEKIWGLTMDEIIILKSKADIAGVMEYVREISQYMKRAHAAEREVKRLKFLLAGYEEADRKETNTP